MEDVAPSRSAGIRAFLFRTDVALALSIFATMVALLVAFKVIRSDEFFGDTAMYFQATENIAARGVAVSQVKASIDGVASTYFTATADQIAKNPSPLFGGSTNGTERSVLLGHVYLILYPIAALVKIFPVKDVFMTLYVLAFAGIILLSYCFLRYAGLSVIGAGLFCLLVVTHPAWWEGLLQGQFYPDRLFILAGFILMLLASRERPLRAKAISQRTWLGVAAIVCASINERGALVAGIFLLTYTALYWTKPGLDRYFKLVLGITLIGYAYAMLKIYVSGNTAYHSFLPSTPSGLLSVIEAPGFVPLITLFLLVNAPLFVLALFEWRAALIAAVLMLPNALGNIGGAEKTGWSTHYASFYLPALVWAAMCGYVVLYRNAKLRKCAPALYAATAALIVFLSLLNPSAYPVDLSLANVPNTFLPAFESQTGTYLMTRGAREALAVAQAEMVRAVPPDSVVSSVEAGLTLLYPHRTMEFFPADIDHAGYAVLGGHIIDGKLNYYGVVSYNDDSERNKLNTLVVDRMRRDGYDLDHPLLLPAFNGLAVVRRAH